MKKAASRIGFALVFVFFVGACSSIDNSAPAEERVAERAQARLDALRAGEVEKAMSFSTPVYRQTTTQRRFSSRYAGAAAWTDARVDEVACEEERCDVRVLVTYQMARAGFENTRPVDQVWILTEGGWYIYEE